MEAIKVNLIPNGIPQTCHASQYDEGRQIRLDLFDGFTPYVIKSGDTFTLNVRKPDNHVIIETITGTEGNTYLVIETSEQMTAVMGKNLCEIRVENDGDNIGSLNFIMEVEKDVIANGIPSESVIEDLEALVAEAVGDDFYTKSEVDDLVDGLIDDESAASNKTWSSEKIDEAVDSIKSGDLDDNSISIKKTDFLEVRIDNLHNTATDVAGSWFTLSNNKVILQSNQYTTTYTAVTVLLPDESISKLTFSSPYQYAYVRDIYFSADLALPASVISSLQPKTYINSPYTIDIPQGTKVLYIAFQNIQGQDVMINKGETALPFEPYNVKYLLDGNELVFSENSNTLELPDSFYSVVGDTLELFYKGLAKVVDSNLLEFDINASEGKAFDRKYVVTPTTTGTKTITIIAKNNNGELLDAKNIDLITVATPTSPNTQKNVLCIGDSLTLDGVWCAELDRRLTGSGGTPSGLNLSNMSFVGTMTNGTTGYEGHGGWTFQSYLSSMASDEFMLINGTFDKTSADQHSIYKDSNNKQWKLETITANQIKIIRVSTSGTLPSSGTLTWVSGGVNTGNIVYSSSEQAAGNPFWNDELGDIDFVTYASDLGISSIDYAVILLGWNNLTLEDALTRQRAETFISKLHRDYPNCEVILLGLQTPSRNGLAVNYGTDWKYFTTMQNVWRINNVYKSIAEETAKVYYVNLAGQFDAEYGYPTTTTVVNVRSSETEELQTNGIHPNTSGRYQIADAVYRRICGLL